MHRKMLSYFFALAFATGAFLAHAEIVGEDVARAAAEGFLSKSSVAKTILSGRSVDSVESRGSLWIVRLAPSGYIEVAGSTKCAPILSFSENDFAEPEVGSPFAAKLTSDTQIVEAKEADEDAADNAGWSKYTAPVATKRTLLGAKPTGTDGTGYSSFVAPMLGATWHQTAPYNDLSPYNYFCGCMATAAGQELRYWRWPYRCENFRSSAHGVRDAKNNYHTLNLHLNGLVPFDWDKIKANYTDESNASTPWANDKQATYNAAYLTLWAQSLTGMGYKPGGSGGTQQLASNAEIFGYEGGRVYTYWGDGYTNLWNAIKADLDWGSPIQINTAAHQMVIDGYAIENEGEENEIDYINLNLGYGNATYWDNLKTAVTEGTYSGTLAAFQTGYRPQKIVQFEPVPKVSTSEVTLTWHMAPCYTNRTSGFTLEIAKTGGAKSNVQIPTHGEKTTYTASGLEMGGEYTFSVCPVMVDGEGTGRTNSVTTTIGEPKAAPEFLNVSSVACGIELLQQDIFIECAYGQVNDIKVTCSESTTSLTNYSSHTTIIPDNKISVTKEGNVFTVSVDATDMLERWNVDGEMILLTMVASNDDGTEAYKNLMLRFNSMRQVINGTFDAAEGDSNSAVWFCGDTTIDAKGRAVSFGASAFQGTGKVTLTDSVGGGSFTFASLDNFRGTLVFLGNCSVTLPQDMTGFSGTLKLASGTYNISSDFTSDATIILGGEANDYESVVVNLNSVSWGATVTGWGTINIASGECTFTKTIASNSTLVNLTGGTLTIPADDTGYCYVQMNGGTLKVKLTEAQTQLGYTWNLPLYHSGDIKFVLSDDTEEDVTVVTGGGLPTISHETDANIWTGDNYWFDPKYSDTSKWSKGTLPNDGDYVIFNSVGDESEGYNGCGTAMILNLPSAVNLGYVQVKGNSGLEITTSSGISTAVLKVGVLENQVMTKIKATEFQPEIVIPKRTLYIAYGNPLTCDLEYRYADNLKQSNSSESALKSSDYWQGTVLLSNQNINNFEISNYGNAQSKIRFNGVTGYLMGGKTFDGTLELVDYGDAPALNISSGSSNYGVTIGSVTGDGTFKTSGSATSLNILLKDISGWTGSFDLADKTIAIGQATPSSYTGTDGRLHICQAATVAEDATWKANGGLYLGAGGVLTINGAVETKNVTTYGSGASITLEDGAVLQVAAASANDVAPTLNFKAGTYRVKEGSDAFRETATINFCAASGKRTVIDANGATLTLGPNVFSGSGDVYLTSSKEGGKIIVEGVPAAYTGRIYCDISCGVSLGDLSKATGCTVDVSDITISRSSSDIGNLTIDSGASLEVTVSKAHIMSGLEIDSVTLVNGGTLVLRDKDGKNLEYTTVNGKYILAADSSVTAECLLDYEFTGNAVSTGSDNNATLQASSTITYYDSSALYTKCTPWISKEFAMPDDEWTAVVRGTLPVANSTKPTIVLMFGANSGDIFGLVAGTEENTVAIADRSGIIGNAVVVEDATTKYHVFTIVKTASRVRLYVDGELKVDETKTISVPKKFQFGSVHGGNNSSCAACTGDESRIDYFKFYDFAVGENFDEMVYPGPKPVAVWTGDFGTKFDGCSLDWHDNEFSDGKITIKDGYKGVDVNLKSGTNAITVIVKYSGLSYSTTTNRLFFTSCADSGYTYDRTAIRLTTSNKVNGSYNGSTSGGTAASGSYTEMDAPASSGYMVFSYGHPSDVNNRGSLICTGTEEGSLNTTNFWASGLKYDADSNNNSIYGATIGGSRKQTSTWGNAADMKIEAIAVFTDRLSAEARNEYVFSWPKVPELTISPASGSVDWGTELTASCDDDTATIWYKKYGDADYTQYTEPVVLNVPGINYYNMQVRDADDNVVVADTMFTYWVGYPPEVTFTVEVPDNMAVTVDGEAYTAGDELTRRVGDNVEINYTVTGAYAGNNQSQTVTIAMNTTTIGVPPGYVAPVAAVSQIVGGNGYDTLQGAIDAAESGATIILLTSSSEDITLNKTIVFSEGEDATFSGTFTGSGTLKLGAFLKNSKTPSGVSPLAAGWAGTVELMFAFEASGFATPIARYGNANSTLRLTGGMTGGWLANVALDTTIELVGDMAISDFSTSFANTIKKLTGTGTFSITYSITPDLTYSGYYPYYLIKDISGFEGSLTIPENGTIGIVVGASSKPSDKTHGGKILVYTNVVASANWSAPNGIVLADTAATLTVEDGVTVSAVSTSLSGYGVVRNGNVYSVERVTNTDYPVPYSWFLGYGVAEGSVDGYKEATAANRQNTWWQCYVLGLDPTNETSKFEVSIRMEGQTPIVEYSPTNDTIAIEYILQGNMGLSDEGWSDCPSFDAPGDTNRFFRVKVKW